MSLNINWQLFTIEEKTHLKDLINKGNIGELMSVIENLDPEKEMEIQKIVDEYAPIPMEDESEAQKEIEKAYASDNLQNLTPEKEAELQKKLDDEKKEKAEKRKKKTAKKSDDEKSEVKK